MVKTVSQPQGQLMQSTLLLTKDVSVWQYLSLKDKYFKLQLQESVLKLWFNLWNYQLTLKRGIRRAGWPIIFQEKTHGHGSREVQKRMSWPIKVDLSLPMTWAGVSLAFTVRMLLTPGRPEGSNWTLMPWWKGQGRSFCHLTGIAHSTSAVADATRKPRAPFAHSTHVRQTLRVTRTAEPCRRLTSHVHHIGNFWAVMEC